MSRELDPDEIGIKTNQYGAVTDKDYKYQSNFAYYNAPKCYASFDKNRACTDIGYSLNGWEPRYATPDGCVLSAKYDCVSRKASIGDQCCTFGYADSPHAKCLTTDPTHRLCHDSMKNFCTGDKASNIFHNPRCRRWANLSKNKELAAATKASFCNDPKNMDNPRWKQYCLDWCQANPGKCDKTIPAYCRDPAEYKFRMKTDLCSCLNEYKGVSASKLELPHCFYNPCVASGYKTQAQLTYGKCPDIIKCTQNIDVSGDNNILSNVELDQSCVMNKEVDGGNASNDNSNDTLNTTVFNNTDDPSDPIDSNDPNDPKGTPDLTLDIILISIFFFIVVIFIFIILRMLKKSKNTND